MPPAATSPPGHRKHGGERHQEKAGVKTGEKTPEKGLDKAKNVSHVPCKFFRQSMCQAGDKCPFSHEVESDAQAVCKYFQKGNCKFGSKCALAHITPDGRQVNKKAGKELSRRRERHRDEKRLDKHYKDSEEDGFNPTSTEYAQISSKPASNAANVSGSPPGYARVAEPSVELLQAPFGSRASFSHTSDTSNADSSVELASRILSKYSNTGSPPSKAFQAFGMRSLSMGLPRRSSANWGNSNFGSNISGFAEGSAILDDEDEFNDDRNARGRFRSENATQDACESDEEEGYTEQLVPSALQDLLTPTERERRNSRTSQQRPGRVNSSPVSAHSTIPATLPLLASVHSPASAPVYPVGFNNRRGSTSSETMTSQSSLWSPRNTAAPFYKPGPYASPPIQAASLVPTHPPQSGAIASADPQQAGHRQAGPPPAHPANFLPSQYPFTPIGSGTNGEASSKLLNSPAVGRFNNFAAPITSGSPENSAYRPFQQYHSVVPTEKF